MTFTRRGALTLGAGAALATAAGLRPARAAVRIDVTQGNVQPLPIALPDFVGGNAADSEMARNVTGVITNNLRKSGLFAPIDPAAFIERITNPGNVPRFPDWRQINAQALVTGGLTRQSDGRLKAEFRLWDVFGGAAAGRPAIFHDAGQLAAHQPHHLGRDLRAPHRREGLFRHAHRVRR